MAQFKVRTIYYLLFLWKCHRDWVQAMKILTLMNESILKTQEALWKENEKDRILQKQSAGYVA